MSDGRIKRRLKEIYGVEDRELALMASLDMWIYSYTHENPLNHLKPKVMIDGFEEDELQKLWELAIEAGFQVVNEVHRDLSILIGGPSTVEWAATQADKKGVTVMPKSEFVVLAQHITTRDRLFFEGIAFLVSAEELWKRKGKTVEGNSGELMYLLLENELDMGRVIRVRCESGKNIDWRFNSKVRASGTSVSSEQFMRGVESGAKKCQIRLVVTESCSKGNPLHVFFEYLRWL